MTARGTQGRRDDRLEVACWCESKKLLLPASEVRAGRTGSCGRDGCNASGETPQARPPRTRSPRPKKRWLPPCPPERIQPGEMRQLRYFERPTKG